MTKVVISVTNCNACQSVIDTAKEEYIELKEEELDYHCECFTTMVKGIPKELLSEYINYRHGSKPPRKYITARQRRTTE